MSSMARPVALEQGKNEIALFGDGSFQDILSVGSWAFGARTRLQSAGCLNSR